MFLIELSLTHQACINLTKGIFKKYYNTKTPVFNIFFYILNVVYFCDG